MPNPTGNNGRAQRFGDPDRARLFVLHSEGRSLGECARTLGFSPATVSTHASRMGLKWDRSVVEPLVRARQADGRAKRAALQQQALDKAKDLLDQLDQAHTVFNFGGKDNTYEERVLERPPTQDIRNLVQSAGVLLTQALRLAEFDEDPGEGLSEVDSWLKHVRGESST